MESILSAHEIGDGFPVLIIHGWKSTGKLEEVAFEPVFKKIPGFRRIYVGLPGMGLTPANGVKDMDEIFLRLTQFVDSRFAKSRFLLIGSSCGGYLARALAQKYVDRVDGLLLRVPLIEPDDSMRDLDTFTPLVANDGLMSSMTSCDRALLGNVLIQTPAYVTALKAKWEEVWNPAEAAADSEAIDHIRADPHRYQLSSSIHNDTTKIWAPALILSGRQDESVGYRDSLRLLDLCPRSTLVVLDRGIHGLPVSSDETDLFEALVRDWVIRVREWQNRIDK